MSGGTVMFLKKFQVQQRFAAKLSLGRAEIRELSSNLLKLFTFFQLDQFF